MFQFSRKGQEVGILMKQQKFYQRRKGKLIYHYINSKI